MKSKSRANEKATAYHEAGHAVAAWTLNRSFRHVSIEPDEGTLGHVRYYAWPKAADPEFEWTPRIRLLCENAIVTALAGPWAEKLLTGRWNNVGARSDRGQALDFALQVCGWSEERARAYLGWLDLTARDLVGAAHHWRGIRALATTLLKRKRISGPEARQVISAAVYPPPPRQRLSVVVNGVHQQIEVGGR